MMDVAATIGLSEAKESRIANITEIALEFTGMLRVFEEGSNIKIIPKLREFFDGLAGIEDKAAYDWAHAEFCNWFVANIWTAEKKLKNGTIKPSVACSYGHGAKVLDIATKVYVYYCREPSGEIAARLLPMLNAGLDTPMMKDLDPTNAKDTIQEVDRAEYERLQGVVAARIAGSGLHPVQYDDVMWRRLQRGQR
jgi:hypothetical protein